MSFHYTVETTKTIEEAVNSLEEVLKNYKFGILWNFDLTAKLQEKGQNFNVPYRILEVCNPIEANRVLTQNQQVGYFLPCKIAVYKDGDTTKIGLPKPSMLMEVINDPALKDIAAEVETNLINAINEAK
jgi:uncharacterized protein (DUF302 family)